MSKGERTALYRHYDANGDLLYVGMSLCATGRLKQHERASTWYADIADVKIQWFEDRFGAAQAEAIAIRNEKPKYNKAVPKVLRFDASKHFDTPEAQARLIDDALRSGNAGYIANALGVVAKAKGMSALAKDTGLSRQSLYAALSENGNPSLDTLVKVMRALGIDLHAAAANDVEGARELAHA